MRKEEVVEIIKNKINTDYYYLQEATDAYIEGFLDALCKTYEISWEERYEIERELEEAENE